MVSESVNTLHNVTYQKFLRGSEVLIFDKYRNCNHSKIKFYLEHSRTYRLSSDRPYYSEDHLTNGSLPAKAGHQSSIVLPTPDSLPVSGWPVSRSCHRSSAPSPCTTRPRCPPPPSQPGVLGGIVAGVQSSPGGLSELDPMCFVTRVKVSSGTSTQDNDDGKTSLFGTPCPSTSFPTTLPPSPRPGSARYQ